MTKWMTLCAMIFAISGCASISPSQQVTVGNACGAFSIIRPSRLDTEETKKQVLAHNRVYRVTCQSNAASR